MILYYTRSQKTKVFAEALHDILGLPIYELESDINSLNDFKFLIKALGMVFSDKGCPVNNMPTSVPEEIYVCGPVWGGRLVGPPRYFLNNMDLSNTKVNILLTASTPVEKYRERALGYLTVLNCIPGNAYIFATAKDLPEKEVITEQLREILDSSGDGAVADL